MTRASTLRVSAIWTVAIGLALACASVSFAEEAWEPARTTADTLDNHRATTEDPDEMVAETEDPDDMVAETENPDDMVAETRDPDSMVVETDSLEEHEGRTYDLSDLPEVAPDKGFEAVDMWGQREWTPASDATIIVARRNVVRAEKRAQAARDRYGEMMQNNYPRGAGREAIVRERDESMKQLELAKQALLDAEGGGSPANRR